MIQNRWCNLLRILWDPGGAVQHALTPVMVYILLCISGLLYWLSLGSNPALGLLYQGLPVTFVLASITGTLFGPLVSVHVKSGMYWVMWELTGGSLDYDKLTRIIWVSTVPLAVQQICTAALNWLIGAGDGWTADLTMAVLVSKEWPVLKIVASTLSPFDLWSLSIRVRLFQRLLFLSTRAALWLNLIVFGSTALILAAFGVAFAPRW